MYKYMICDIDGSLMPIGAGIHLKEEIMNAMIQLEEKGIKIILNSARSIQGVLPMAKELKMEEFGGYVISGNGAHVYDVKKQETVFEYTLSKEDALSIWKYCLDRNLSISFSQKDYMVSSDFHEGFVKDWFNCNVDYIVVHDPTLYLKNPVWKCMIAQDKKVLMEKIHTIKEDFKKYPVKVAYSEKVGTLADVCSNQVDKEKTASRLLKMIDVDWKDVTTIGDTDADALCIQKSGLGVTLENGTDLCKEYCDLLVPSCMEDGCMVWLNQLLGETQ